MQQKVLSFGKMHIHNWLELHDVNLILSHVDIQYTVANSFCLLLLFFIYSFIFLFLFFISCNYLIISHLSPDFVMSRSIGSNISCMLSYRSASFFPLCSSQLLSINELTQLSHNIIVLHLF